MKTYFGTEKLPSFRNAVITTGTFDGVHLGHKELLKRINQLAKQVHGESVIITFHPHPRLVVNKGETNLKVLTSLNEKTTLLSQAGINHMVVVPFDKAFSEMEAEEYIKYFLVEKFNPSVIVLGYNHQFGHHRDGNINLLEKFSTVFHYRIEEIERQLVDDIDVSSTKIRVAVQEGEIERANHLLGHAYGLQGIVKRGKQLGRKLGYPTANIDVDDFYKLIPATGIYAVKVQVLGKEFNGMMSVGYNPTFSETKLSLEVNIFNFDKEIYAQEISVTFLKRMRDEKKFDHIDDLIAAIKQDEKNAKKYFAV